MQRVDSQSLPDVTINKVLNLITLFVIKLKNIQVTMETLGPDGQSLADVDSNKVLIEFDSIIIYQMYIYAGCYAYPES